MATVPRIQGFGVAPEATPGFRQSNPIDAGVASIGARQAQAFGDALGNLGGAVMQQEKQARDQADALRVDDAENSLREQALRLQYDKKDGFTSQTGFDAVNRQSGKPLADEYADELNKHFGTIRDSLASDRQKQMFNMRANNVLASFHGQAMAYEGAQYREYNASVLDATVKTSANELVLNPLDDNGVAANITRLRGAIEGGIDPATNRFVPGSAQYSGKSAAWAAAKADEAVSGALTASVKSLLEQGNINSAMAFRQKYAGKFQPSDLLQIDGVLQRDVDTRQGQIIGSQVFAAAQSALQPADIDRLRTVRDRLESARGDFNPDGSLVLGPVTKSGERAMGGTQVMPSTAKDPGYGIKPADLSGTPQQQAAELRRVGDQKLDVLVKMFDGDPMKALAAYNWGEGKVQKAVKAAQQNAGKGEAVGPTAWMASLPAETRNYVEKASRMLADPVASAPRKPTAEDLHEQARIAAGPNASPMKVKAALDIVTQKFQDQQQAFTQRGNEAVIAMQQEIDANGGSASLVRPSTREAVVKYAPGKLDEMFAYAARIKAGQPVETDWNTYSQLRDLAAAQPQAFASLDLRAQFTKLAPAQREQLLDLQAKAKDPKSAPGVASLDAQLKIAHELLKFKLSDAEEKGRFDSAVMTEIAAEQRRTGRELTFDERQKTLDRFMVSGEVPGKVFGTNSRRYYQVANTEAVNQFALTVPDVEKEKITAALKRAGKPVTPQEIGRLYRAKVGL